MSGAIAPIGAASAPMSPDACARAPAASLEPAQQAQHRLGMPGRQDFLRDPVMGFGARPLGRRRKRVPAGLVGAFATQRPQQLGGKDIEVARRAERSSEPGQLVGRPRGARLPGSSFLMAESSERRRRTATRI